MGSADLQCSINALEFMFELSLLELSFSHRMWDRCLVWTFLQPGKLLAWMRRQAANGCNQTSIQVLGIG